jgi:hypothetical protein
LSTITLPVGEVAKLTGHIPNDISDVPRTDSFDAFVPGTPETVYYVVFRCDRESRATYEEQFQQIAATFTLLPSAASATP